MEVKLCAPRPGGRLTCMTDRARDRQSCFPRLAQGRALPATPSPTLPRKGRGRKKHVLHSVLPIAHQALDGRRLELAELLAGRVNCNALETRSEGAGTISQGLVGRPTRSPPPRPSPLKTPDMHCKLVVSAEIFLPLPLRERALRKLGVRGGGQSSPSCQTRKTALPASPARSVMHVRRPPGEGREQAPAETSLFHWKELNRRELLLGGQPLSCCCPSRRDCRCREASRG